MNIAIITPGPSVTKTFPPVAANYPLVIGVNRAVHLHPCQWFVFCDYQIFLDHAPDYFPGIFTQEAAENGIRLGGQSERFEKHRRAKFDWLTPQYPVKNWTLFSATAALVLGAWLGAKRIDVFGADWSDAADWDSVAVVGQNRAESRWAVERQIWGSVVEMLNDRGVTVERKLWAS